MRASAGAYVSCVVSVRAERPGVAECAVRTVAELPGAVAAGCVVRVGGRVVVHRTGVHAAIQLGRARAIVDRGGGVVVERLHVGAAGGERVAAVRGKGRVLKLRGFAGNIPWRPAQPPLSTLPPAATFESAFNSELGCGVRGMFTCKRRVRSKIVGQQAGRTGGQHTVHAGRALADVIVRDGVVGVGAREVDRAGEAVATCLRGRGRGDRQGAGVERALVELKGAQPEVIRAVLMIRERNIP